MEHRGLAGEALPALDRDVDVSRVEFDAEANPPRRLGRDQRGARAHEWLVDRLTRRTVVEDRPAHALDRLLGPVDGLGVLVPAGDLPERRLLAIPGPVPLAAFADSVKARFMLPVIIASAQHQAFFGPDELAPDSEAGDLEALGDGRRVQCAVREVGDVTRE